MANESINVNYVGRDATEYISRSTLGARSIAGGFVTPKTNISERTAISILEVTGDLIQGYSPDFIAQGGYSLSQRFLDPRHLMVNLELDKSKLLHTWESDKMTAGAMNKEIPADFQSYLMSKVEEGVAVQVEANLWRGSYVAEGAYVQKFDGILTLAGADADVVKVTGAQAVAAFTTANIKTELAKAYNALDAEITEQTDFKLYVSPTTAKIYRQSLGDYENQSSVGKKPLDFEGVMLVPTTGIVGNNTIVGSRIQNLMFGTDLISDLNQFVVKDMFESTLEDKLRIKAVMFACANYAFGAEMVLYKA